MRLMILEVHGFLWRKEHLGPQSRGPVQSWIISFQVYCAPNMRNPLPDLVHYRQAVRARHKALKMIRIMKLQDFKRPNTRTAYLQRGNERRISMSKRHLSRLSGNGKMDSFHLLTTGKKEEKEELLPLFLGLKKLHWCVALCLIAIIEL